MSRAHINYAKYDCAELLESPSLHLSQWERRASPAAETVYVMHDWIYCKCFPAQGHDL